MFRIGHLGDTNDLTVLGTLAGCEMGLGLAGVPHKTGGVTAAMAYLFPQSFRRGEPGKAAAKLYKLLGQVKLEQQGADITASIKTDAAGVLGAIEALQNIPPR